MGTDETRMKTGSRQKQREWVSDRTSPHLPSPAFIRFASVFHPCPSVAGLRAEPRAMKWQLHLFKDNRPIGAPLECEGVVDLGRQDTALDKEKALPPSVVLPFRYGLRPGVTRVVMALSTE